MSTNEGERKLTPRPPYIGPGSASFNRATLQNSSPAFDDVSDDHLKHTLDTMGESAEYFVKFASGIEAKDK